MSRLSSLLMLCPALALAGEPAKTPVVVKAPVAAEASPLDLLLDEQKKWAFDPQVRADVFIDLEELRKAQKAISEKEKSATALQGANRSAPGADRDKTLDWAKHEVARVEGFVLARKWDDAMKVCENAWKVLARFGDDAEVARVVERFKRYHAQAEEAKVYEEAQAKFDALGLKVEGILWDPQKGSMAVIGGEARALRLNDRVKDCVVINIDTNRVDFLFHHNRRRFEFQRFVGEDVKTGTK